MDDKVYAVIGKADKQKLLRRLQICEFVLAETAMYLDSHPNDKQALAYFNKHLAMERETHAEYVEKYGPITHTDNTSLDTWKWIENPWPWEMMEE